MWFNVLGMGIKTAAKLYSDKQKTKEALSEARLLHAEKMKRGEIEYKGKVFEHQKGDWKDEFVLLALMIPAICAFLPFMQPHIERGFEILSGLPEYYRHLLYLACSVSLGVRAGPAALNMFKKK